MSTPSRPSAYTAFAGERRLARGDLQTVALAVKAAHDARELNLIAFDDATGGVVDLDLRGGAAEVVGRLPAAEPAAEEHAPAKAGRGRPKLGVAAREVTLMPRHWDWLAKQPGGASAMLRKLVEHTMRAGLDAEQARAAQTAAYKAMYVLAGHLPHYEEALRALYAPDRARFEALIETWPADITSYVRGLAAAAFEKVAAPRTDI